jgi:hypothetical protein
MKEQDIISLADSSISLVIVAYTPPLLLFMSSTTLLQSDAMITLEHSKSALSVKASLHAKASRSAGLLCLVPSIIVKAPRKRPLSSLDVAHKDLEFEIMDTAPLTLITSKQEGCRSTKEKAIIIATCSTERSII